MRPILMCYYTKLLVFYRTTLPIFNLQQKRMKLYLVTLLAAQTEKIMFFKNMSL